MVKIIEVVEIFDFVFLGFAQQSGGEEDKHHFAKVTGGAHTPMFEDSLCQRAELVEGMPTEPIG